MGRLVLTLGLLGAIGWLILPFFPPECAPPTGASEVFCNRLWTPSLAAMFVGTLALVSNSRGRGRWLGRAGFLVIAIGFGLMVAGNFGEYWLAYRLPHEGGIGGVVRGILWMSVLAGWLVALLGATIAGLAAIRDGIWAAGTRLLFLLPLPLTFLFAFVGPNLAPMGVALVGFAVALHGLRSRPTPWAAPA